MSFGQNLSSTSGESEFVAQSFFEISASEGQINARKFSYGSNLKGKQTNALVSILLINPCLKLEVFLVKASSALSVLITTCVLRQDSAGKGAVWERGAIWTTIRGGGRGGSSHPSIII
jgi:hypothetical protein